MKYMALKPRISEKAYALSEQRNVYVFDVPSGANKHDIAKSVADQYEVKVTNVRISSVPGKAVRSYRQRGRKSIAGQRSDIRKAYVTLKAGDNLPFFAGAEEAEEKEPAVQEKTSKSVAKEATQELKTDIKPARRGLHLRQNRGGDK